MMTKSSFVMNTDPDTHLRFITKTDELSKNHRGSDSQAHTGFMTETGTTNCPVASFTKFLSKLHPDQNRLWCYGRDAFDPNDNVWYTRKPVGINTLDKFLPELSQRCNLSRVYTNHSIRATTATVHVLHQERFDLKEVQSVTGHKSLSSLAIYQRTSGHQKHTMAKALHSRVTGTQYSENCTHFRQQTTARSETRLVSNQPRALFEGQSTSATERGGRAELEEIDLNVFFDTENEPEDIGTPTRSLFQNCKIGTVHINIIKNKIDMEFGSKRRTPLKIVRD